MKSLVIVAHPDLKKSRINRTWHQKLLENDIATYNLYDKYPNEEINVEEEHERMEQVDRIVLQFPFYWYSSPALLKKWIDTVMTFGWAYGQDGNALQGKELLLAISTGGPAEAYSAEGYNKYPINDLLLPFRAMANLTKMNYVDPFVVSGVRTLSEEELATVSDDYLERIRT
jgi:glutathione-regulated potassium-efflux system ancillary protein KefG